MIADSSVTIIYSCLSCGEETFVTRPTRKGRIPFYCKDCTAEQVTRGVPWTPDRIETLKRMWNAGAPMARIVAALGTTQAAVISKKSRLGLVKRHPNRYSFATKQKVLRLKREGRTFSEIAKEIGVSRNCVAGLIHRLAAEAPSILRGCPTNG